MADRSLDLALTAVHEELTAGDETAFVGGRGTGQRWRSHPWFPFCPGEDALIGVFLAY